MEPLVLFIGIVVFVLVIIAAVFIPLRRLAAQREQAARQRFPNAKRIVPGALFYGQESRGVRQLRGNGTLVLTDSELYFEKWLPRHEHRITLDAIQAIETPSSYLGKTNFRPLLKVVFKDAAGNIDSMGWLVSDLEGTIRALEEARRQSQ
jgi:hypothetical protein